MDRTEADHTWSDQDKLFRRMLTISRPDKVLVLHLRGASNRHSSEVLLSALHLVRKTCQRSQKIHLHCFTGTEHDVEEWLQELPNCHFGFTGRVASYSQEQLIGLKAVPMNRILLETDSPYMLVNKNLEANTPAYIGDVAHLVAYAREIGVDELLAASSETGRQLYA